jgi:hypothetical protein
MALREQDILDAIDNSEGDEGTLDDGRPFWYSLALGEFWVYAEDEEEFGDHTEERWTIELSAHKQKEN